MRKGNFEPGKKVILIRAKASWATKFVGSVCTLVRLTPTEQSPDTSKIYWDLREIPEYCCWKQNDMILIDPDETPEESTEAMRRLHDTTVKEAA